MAAMAWTITDDVHEFLAAAGAYLRSRTAENTILLSVAEGLRVGASPSDADPALGWWTNEDGTVGAAFLHTPPYGLALSSTLPDVGGRLAESLADRGRAIPQIAGDHACVDAFTQAWLRRNPGTTAAVAMNQRLYRLGDLTAPTTPGASKVADVSDRDLLIAWRTAFQHDVGAFVHGDTGRAIDNVLSYRGMTLWTVDGAPMSMASLTRAVAGMVRVGSVYTPPEHRRNGYAAAVVAAVSLAARGAGATEVVLFTDLANPTSNGVYQRIGFQPVSDSIVVDLLRQ
jgi:predicted GNAT family acetyltransferase